MPSITDYENNINQALIDAVAEPSIREFMDESDVEIIAIDIGDGMQAQVEALTGDSVRKIIERIIGKSQKAGVDMKNWICSEDEFNLCSKLGTSVGELMRNLDCFLKQKAAQGGLILVGLATLFGAAAWGVALTIFGALGFVNNHFIELCGCNVSA